MLRILLVPLATVIHNFLLLFDLQRDARTIRTINQVYGSLMLMFWNLLNFDNNLLYLWNIVAFVSLIFHSSYEVRARSIFLIKRLTIVRTIVCRLCSTMKANEGQ